MWQFQPDFVLNSGAAVSVGTRNSGNYSSTRNALSRQGDHEAWLFEADSLGALVILRGAIPK